MNDIQVHPDTLRAAATSVEGTADRTAPALGHWLDASFRAAGGLTGWESGGALNDCTQGWQAHISAVLQQLQSYADQLRTSANSYDAVDQEAARRFRQAVADLNAQGN
ncbi:WXG100 family type VII secretion target [Kitasatospora sp. NPDC008050]|uniref:WXG100 family type VII secretion target n=1 Tax=Kitasatospora sp. NPDC008050 TaxID=3364021 RepID=UPI0036E52C64